VEETSTASMRPHVPASLPPGHIRQMLHAGGLEGIPPEESDGRGWKIPVHVVHDRDRPARKGSARVRGLSTPYGADPW
jgi:hypothetical protein